MDDRLIRILLIEDDEDDYIIFRDLISEIRIWKCQADWASTPDSALEKLSSCEYDICFLDFRLGEENGIDFMETLGKNRFDIPVIMLTGYGDHETDLEAMRHGAVDYLEKSNLGSVQLERAIRYAIRNSDIVKALKKSEEKLRILSSKILDAQEEERKSLARELHDSIGSSLTGILFALEQKIDNMGSSLKTPPGTMPLERIREMIKDIIDETQRISSNLRPSTLDALGLLPAIRSFCRNFKEIYRGMEVNTQIDIKEDDVPEKIKIILYRIIQEALNNAAKHSEAKRLNLNINRITDYLELVIRDDGKGFIVEETIKNERQSKNMGLIGMIERADLSGGKLKILSEKGNGTIINARFPI